MQGRSRRTRSLVAAIVAGALAAALLPGLGGADTAPSLRARAASLAGTEHGALLELYALESSLARARARAAELGSRSTVLEARARAAQRSARVVRTSLASSHARVAETLRRLYVEGEGDPIAVLLGATSMDEALAGLESLERATDRNRRLVAELGARLARVRVVEARLAARRSALVRAIAEAQRAERDLSSRVAAKRAYLAELRGELSLTRERIRELADRARTAERAAARLTPSPPPASAPAEKPLVDDVASGERTMVVDAVAYHLPGLTASGLPVGPGIVAVDPAVIPLGTRMFVPGYGPAIAADVGSAVKGALIDLWFPSTAQARAWGRRTVTITLYS